MILVIIIYKKLIYHKYTLHFKKRNIILYPISKVLLDDRSNRT